MAISNNDVCDASKLLNLLVHANLRESGKLESAKRFRLASGLDDPSPMLDLSLIQLLIDYVKDAIADDHDDHHAERSDSSPDDDPGLSTSFDDRGEFDYVGELSELFAGAAGPPRETDGCPRWVIAALFTIIVLGGYYYLRCILFATVISSLLGYMHLLMPIIVICIVMFLWADDT